MTNQGCEQFDEVNALVTAGAATPDEVSAFDAHLNREGPASAGCPACSNAYKERLNANLLFVKALPPIAPPPAVRTRLLDAVTGIHRFEPFFQKIADLCDLSVEAVKGLLARIDEASAWERGQFPFIRLIHFQAGPRLSTAEAGFVRTAAGATFPRHRHLGSEITLVLEGGLWDNGRHYLPREIIEKDTDSVHEYRADPERDLITVVVYHGIDIL